MHEVLRTNDPVLISWTRVVLEEAGIASVVLDAHASLIEGSIGAIQQRVMVASDDASRARWVLETARRVEADGDAGD